MAYEVDFMAVGEGEKSGDAIAVRFGNLAGPRSEQTVYVIDGGTKDSGEALVSHIQKFYHTDLVDVVISTHPDSDHSFGLAVVLEKLRVGCLLMHQPWNHAEDIHHLFDHDDRVTPTGLEERAWRSLENVRDLEKLAAKKGIKIIEPFSDTLPDVLSPSKAFYQQQLANFRCMPEPAQKASIRAMMELVLGAVKEAIKRIAETWFTETLTEPEPDATSAENNSSVLLLLDLGGERFLFTADAGVPALTAATDRATALGIDLKTVKYLQVPHHGSKRNVGPAILDRILGPKLAQDSPSKIAFVSAAKDGGPKHPAKKVVNAFQRRGAKVFATQGNGLSQHSPDAPKREGWSDAVKLSFYQEVDE
jgi:beta-lactamase superfamily II metal-dependent hydrolase